MHFKHLPDQGWLSVYIFFDNKKNTLLLITIITEAFSYFKHVTDISNQRFTSKILNPWMTRPKDINLT